MYYTILLSRIPVVLLLRSTALPQLQRLLSPSTPCLAAARKNSYYIVDANNNKRQLLKASCDPLSLVHHRRKYAKTNTVNNKVKNITMEMSSSRRTISSDSTSGGGLGDDELQKSTFTGREDRYNGIIVDSSRESYDESNFTKRLCDSLERWRSENKSTIWFHVYLKSSDWIPCLVQEGFKFHHAKEQYVTMYKWLPTKIESNIPPYAHTNLGIGGFVFDDDTGEILVVKDKRSVLNGLARWKLPGGIVDPGENIPEAVMREVTEETGIRTKFESLLGFRHAHGYAFECSDIYIVARLKPLTRIIKKCEREIADCTWMKLEEYASDPNIVENNRILAQAMLDYTKNRTGLRLIKGQHPLTKESVSIYLL